MAVGEDFFICIDRDRQTEKERDRSEANWDIREASMEFIGEGREVVIGATRCCTRSVRLS